MTAAATGTAISALTGALSATARQLSRPRAVVTAFAVGIVVAVALLVPLPTAVQVQEWARTVGPWFPLAFLAAHVVATVAPIPRTAFTLAAGLLFGPLLGALIAVVASAASAVIALLLVRAAGWQLRRLVRHGAIDKVDQRLRERGWLAVLSLRLIPVVPFSALNYAAGASAVRVLPFAVATVAGLLPGTIAVVVLGDALAGHPDPLLYLMSLCTSALGLLGLVFEVRHYRRRHHHRSAHRSVGDESSTEPAIS